MISEQSREILLIGGPSTGKTHYGAQLLGRLTSYQGEIQLRDFPNSIAPFQEALHRLNQGLPASHTPQTTYHEVVLPVDIPGIGITNLVLPDYGGEQIKLMLEHRLVSPDWEQRITRASGWLIFVRLSGIRSFEDVFSRPPAILTARSEDRASEGIWSSQANVIELLQVLLFVKGVGTQSPITHPRLSIVLTCWDELSEMHQILSPLQVLEQHMPLLADFILTNWAQDHGRILGLSSLGKALRDGHADIEYLDKGPEHFGYIVLPNGERSPDLTLPVTLTIS